MYLYQDILCAKALFLMEMFLKAPYSHGDGQMFETPNFSRGRFQTVPCLCNIF